MSKRPNFLWIYCDQLRKDALSCYHSNKLPIRTPAIDSIADNGVVFDNCYCNAPICVPSRTSILTACYPEKTGVYGNEGAWRSYPYDRDLVTFPEWFSRAGYFTANMGKTHVPRTLNPWNESNCSGAELGRFFNGINKDEMDLVKTSTMKSPLAGSFPAGHKFPGEQVTENAISWLNKVSRESMKPFLLRVGYLQPHTPSTPPPPFDTIYQNVNWPREIDLEGNLSLFERTLAEIQNGHELTPDQIARIHFNYYGLVAWLDGQIQHLLTTLESLHLSETTVIIVESDHGVALGEVGGFAKQSFIPEVHNIPRIICWPKEISRGEQREDINESIDLARTLCGLAEIEPAEQFQGRNLFSDPPPEAVYSTIGYGLSTSKALPNNEIGIWPDGSGWPRRGCVRTMRYRLDMNIKVNGNTPSIQKEDMFLIDRETDRRERYNRAQDPLMHEARDQLKQLLQNHCCDSYEPPFIPDFSQPELGND